MPPRLTDRTPDGRRVPARTALATVLVLVATVVTAASSVDIRGSGPAASRSATFRSATFRSATFQSATSRSATDQSATSRSATDRSVRHRATHAGLRLLAASSLPSRALYGWGGNDSGQVGNGAVGGGSSSGVTLPVGITAPAGQTFASVSAGGAFTVGVTTSGRVYAWGAGALGQLGDGVYVGSTAPMPVTVPAPPGGPPAVVTAVAAGSAHALALTSTGHLYAWGANLFGQLGDGTTVRSDVPTAVVAPAGVTFTAVAAGGDHSMALTSDGRVFAGGPTATGRSVTARRRPGRHRPQWSPPSG